MQASVIPARHYRQESTGRTFSLFSSYVPADAVVIENGFTIAWPDGTTGTGRKPFETKEEAEAFIARNPRFKGMSQD